jgi:Acyl-coenzyme A:6-aminopenicillanic acid acyl-transferase
MSRAAVPFVRASGDAFDVGYRHGAVRAAELRAFVGDDLCRINKLAPAPITVESLRPALDAYERAITGAAPLLGQELAGLAHGAGVSAEIAVLLQARREIIGFQRVRARGDCTTYASLSHGPDGGPVLAQTVDLNGDLEDQIAVLDVQLAGSARRALVLSFGGLLGYLGVNSDGLAIGLNLVLGGDWRPGLPPYLAIRHLLDHCGSVAEALDVLRGLLPLASSRSLTLCDPVRLACVEIVEDQLRVVPTPATRSVHTNHFLHPDFTSVDELNVFARNSSLLRLKACEAGLDAIAESGATVEEHFALLSQPGICVAGTGDIRREKTVAAVVLLPGRGELHLRPGDPSRSVTRSFALRHPTAAP